MAIQPRTIKGPFPTTVTVTSVAHGTSLIASASVHIAQKSGTIDRIGLYRTNTGTGTIEVRLETLASNNPSGTLVAAGANGQAVVAVGASNVPMAIALNTPVSVNKGDRFAAVVYLSSVTVSMNIARTIVAMNETINAVTSQPGNRSNTAFSLGAGTGWGNGTISTISLISALYTDDEPMFGSYILGGGPASVVVPASGANSYLGAKLVAEATEYLEGIYEIGRSDGTVQYELYDSSNNLLNTSISFSGGAALLGNQMHYFATPTLLQAGQTYRLVKRAISGASNGLLTMPSYSQALQESVFGVYCLTSSSNGTSWTDTATTVPCITPLTTPGIFGGGKLIGPSSLIG